MCKNATYLCKKAIYYPILSILLLFICFTLPAGASEMTVSSPETPVLIISGSEISRGRGFLHNYVAITSSEMEGIVDSASGEATYRLGLGDCFTEAITYSTYEDHGNPAWIFRRVYGLDLRTMAEALGIDTSQVMSISVYAEDGMSKTLSDAFGVKTSRWTYDISGTRENVVSPVLALYETTSETQEPGKGILPDLPVLGTDSTDRVDNVFGYGQTDFQEITSCYWVKSVRRLRFGTESSALTVYDAGGRSVDMSLSTLISRGVWQAGIGTVRAQGVPVGRLLDDAGITLPDGCSLRAEGKESSVDLSSGQLSGAFVAWQAVDNGSAVNNTTPLRLYYGEDRYGEDRVLADLVSLQIIPDGEQDEPSASVSVFKDLDDYGWAVNAILDLSQRGVVNGLSADTFGPGLNIKRGDFMLMLARAFELTADTEDNFQDVPADSYYFDAIAASRALGIAQGDGEFFRPESAITRQEAFALICRVLTLAGCELPEGDTSFSGFYDGEMVADWAGKPAASLIAAGVIQGSDHMLNPLGSMTRAEMAVTLKRTLDLQ